MIRQLSLLLAPLALSGCIIFPLPVPTPPVAERAGSSTPAFQAGLQAQYPLPISEAELAVRLLGEGFNVNPTGRTASFQHALAVCGRQYLVGWAGEAGQVTAIRGEVVGGCN